MSECGTCKEPLTGPYFTVDESPQCMKCYQLSLPECLGCRKPIDGEYLMAFEATYHKECFKCFECSCVIESTYYQRNGTMICPECQKKQDLICILCRKKGGSQMVTVGKFNIPVHKDCFKCKVCSKIIDPAGTFVVRGNNIYLPACYEKTLTG